MRGERGGGEGWGKGQQTHNHLLHLILHPHATDNLHVLQPAKDLMLDAEAGLHAEGGALLDGERVLVEVLEAAGLGQVDDDVGAALDLQPEREDDDFAGVGRVAEGGAGADAQGLLPFAEGFVVLVWGWGG